MVKLSLPGQVFSKSDFMWPGGIGRAVSGRGGHVRLEDGRELIDMSMGLGTTILGHADERVAEAVNGALASGVMMSRPIALEQEVADRIGTLFPHAGSVRFFTSGSEACQAAIRLARAHTRRDIVWYCGYHGWHDWYAESTTLRHGCPWPMRSYCVPYNDLHELRERLVKILPAAFILEPFRVTEPDPDYLKILCEWCRERGIVTIFDESMTWPRLRLGGAQELWGAQPTLTVLSKGLGNGVPVAALFGDAAVMDGCALISPTFGGNGVSLAAARAVLDCVAGEPVPDRLDKRGRLLKGHFDSVIAAEPSRSRWVEAVGRSCWLHVRFQNVNTGDDLALPIAGADALRTRFIMLMAEHGVLTHGQFVLCMAHTDEDMKEVGDAFALVITLLESEIEDGKLSDPKWPVLRPILHHVHRP